MVEMQLLDEEDIKLLKEHYVTLYQKSVMAGLSEERRIILLRQMMDGVLESSIQGTINSGFKLSQQEINQMCKEFYELVYTWEAEMSGHIS